MRKEIEKILKEYKAYETGGLTHATNELLDLFVVRLSFLGRQKAKQMITTETKIDWLQHVITQKKKAIQEWQFVACRRSICDNMGRSPIDKLNNEIKIAQELIDMCGEK